MGCRPTFGNGIIVKYATTGPSTRQRTTLNFWSVGERKSFRSYQQGENHNGELSQRIITLKRYTEEYSNPWKNILDTFLGEVGRKFSLRCNSDTRRLPIYLPDFFKECLEAWSDLNTTNVVSYDDVVNQIIWNNRHILIEKKSCFIKYVIDHGIVKIGDLISNTGRFLESEKILHLQLSPIHYFKLMGIINADCYSQRMETNYQTKTAVRLFPLQMRLFKLK